MSKQTFPIGQIVCLKSGGSEMTIQTENTNINDDIISSSLKGKLTVGKKLVGMKKDR